MEEFVASLMNLLTTAGGDLVLAIIVFFVGRFLINTAVKMIKKNKLFTQLEATVQTFSVSFITIALYVILAICIVGIMGVPMASVVAVLASAGVAVGLALQGALSNLAGGVMLMVFKPFKQGDFVEAAGVSGIVKAVTMFYTTIVTLDNKQIMVPNGGLMNANVVNYSAEPLRRVDLAFSCGKDESADKVEKIILGAIEGSAKVLNNPEAPFAKVSGGTNEAMQFAVRVWCKNEDYWDVYFDLTRKITDALGKEGIKAPGVRVVADK